MTSFRVSVQGLLSDGNSPIIFDFSVSNMFHTVLSSFCIELGLPFCFYMVCRDLFEIAKFPICWLFKRNKRPKFKCSKYICTVWPGGHWGLAEWVRVDAFIQIFISCQSLLNRETPKPLIDSPEGNKKELLVEQGSNQKFNTNKQ